MFDKPVGDFAACLMRLSNQPASESKQKLLVAAEELFAERGFEVVSVRDITARVKANVAAIHYHFGSRDGLIREIRVRHLGPLVEERGARLEAVEKKGGKAMPLEEVLEAWVRPIQTAARKSDLAPAIFYPLIGRILSDEEPLPAPYDEPVRNVAERFGKAFAKATSLPADDLHARLHFLHGALVHLLIHPLGQGDGPMDTALGRFIRFASASLGATSAPATPAKPSPQGTFQF